MDKKNWLRISYWVAAIADFIIGIRVIMSPLLSAEPYVYPMGLVLSVGICWGILLICATKKPLERRWILGPTIIVVFLISLTYVHALITNLKPLYLTIPAVVIGLMIFILLSYSFWITRDKRRPKDIDN